MISRDVKWLLIWCKLKQYIKFQTYDTNLTTSEPPLPSSPEFALRVGAVAVHAAVACVDAHDVVLLEALLVGGLAACGDAKGVDE